MWTAVLTRPPGQPQLERDGLTDVAEVVCGRRSPRSSFEADVRCTPSRPNDGDSAVDHRPEGRPCLGEAEPAECAPPLDEVHVDPRWRRSKLAVHSADMPSFVPSRYSVGMSRIDLVAGTAGPRLMTGTGAVPVITRKVFEPRLRSPSPLGPHRVSARSPRLVGDGVTA